MNNPSTDELIKRIREFKTEDSIPDYTMSNLMQSQLQGRLEVLEEVKSRLPNYDNRTENEEELYNFLIEEISKISKVLNQSPQIKSAETNSAEVRPVAIPNEDTRKGLCKCSKGHELVEDEVCYHDSWWNKKIIKEDFGA